VVGLASLPCRFTGARRQIQGVAETCHGGTTPPRIIAARRVESDDSRGNRRPAREPAPGPPRDDAEPSLTAGQAARAYGFSAAS